MTLPCDCRMATTDDLDSLVILFDQYRQFYECAPDPVAARVWLDTNLRLGRSVIFVAETNAGIQGFTQLYPALCSVDLVNYFVLYDLYVCDRARRGGIGRALMEAARHWATAQGAARIDLETARSNMAGQRLYKGLGYQLDEVFLKFSLDTDE
jgi:GNAT superfamily N-acetyltransferase